MVKLMAGIVAIFASLSLTPSWEQPTSTKTYDWVDETIMSRKQMQKTQHCYAWVSLEKKAQEKTEKDKK